MKKKLYEYAVLYTPLQTKEQQEKGESPKTQIIVDVTRILAKDEREAGMIAARAISDEHMEHLDQLDIVLRPF